VRILRVVLFTSIIFIFFKSNAQLTGTKLIHDIQYTPAPGKVTIIENNNIVKVLDTHLNEESKKKGITGYRIRIFSDSGPQARKQGELIEAGFLSRFENVRADFIFNSPFYLLYVGDFRTHSEAMKFLKEIESIYPDAFIVRSKINYPSLK
jgi:hypothetical protein